MDNYAEVVEYLRKMGESKIRLLGNILGLDIFKLDKMKTLPDEMVKAWLTKQDKVKEKCGDPLTWGVLVKALRNPTIGQTGIADDIEKDKCSGQSVVRYDVHIIFLKLASQFAVHNN